ncbi:MAG: 3'-5' exonuclease [Cyclobacteriaceae bacterium]
MFVKKILKQEVNQLPLQGYEGTIEVVEKSFEIQPAIKEIIAHPALGFDTETKPVFRKGVYHSVALMQVAIPEKVFLFRLNKIGFPTALRSLFEGQKLKKVGISIRDDLKDLQKLAPYQPQQVIELNQVAKDLGVQNEGARNLTAIFLGFRISKSQQTTNWERDQLTEQQLRYAATDAWVCLEIYQKLLYQGFIQ